MAAKMTIQDYQNIELLMDNGLTPKQIAGLLGKSASGINNYMNVFKAVRENKPFSMHPHNVSLETLTKYCEMNGFNKPINIHPLANGIPPENEDDVRGVEAAIICKLNEIASAISNLTELIREKYCNESVR